MTRNPRAHSTLARMTLFKLLLAGNLLLAAVVKCATPSLLSHFSSPSDINGSESDEEFNRLCGSADTPNREDLASFAFEDFLSTLKEIEDYFNSETVTEPAVPSASEPETEVKSSLAALIDAFHCAEPYVVLNSMGEDVDAWTQVNFGANPQEYIDALLELYQEDPEKTLPFLYQFQKLISEGKGAEEALKVPVSGIEPVVAVEDSAKADLDEWATKLIEDAEMEDAQVHPLEWMQLTIEQMYRKLDSTVKSFCAHSDPNEVTVEELKACIDALKNQFKVLPLLRDVPTD
jgi:hypothetical protein